MQKKNVVLILECEGHVAKGNEKCYQVSGFNDSIKGVLQLSLSTDLSWGISSCGSFYYEVVRDFVKRKIAEYEYKDVCGILLVWPGYPSILKDDLRRDFPNTELIALDQKIPHKHCCQISLIKDNDNRTYYTMSNFRIRKDFEILTGDKDLSSGPSLN